MKPFLATRLSGSVACALLVAGTMAGSSCTKEKPNCGHGLPHASFSFHIVDDQTGLEWFTPPRPFSLDTLKKLNGQRYTAIESGQLTRKLVWSGFGLGTDDGLPESGGDKSFTFLISLNSADTDTIAAQVTYGQVVADACPTGFRYFKSVAFRYNGKPAGSYTNGGFYCDGCNPPVTFRKRP